MRVLLLTVMQAMVVTSVAPHQSALVQGKAMDEASLSRMSAHFERTLARQDPFDDDDGDEFENGDADGDDGAAAEVARNQAEAKNDDFGSGDTPASSFIQGQKHGAAPASKAALRKPHQSALVQGKAMDEASLSRMSAHFERTLARQDPFDDDD